MKGDMVEGGRADRGAKDGLLEARRERFGLSYLVSSDRALPAVAKIIASL